MLTLISALGGTCLALHVALLPWAAVSCIPQLTVFFIRFIHKIAANVLFILNLFCTSLWNYETVKGVVVSPSTVFDMLVGVTMKPRVSAPLPTA